MNIKLKKRFIRRNVIGRKAFYWPRAISHHESLEPGTLVECISNAIGTKPKLVDIIKAEDSRKKINPKKFTVFLEDLTESGYNF